MNSVTEIRKWIRETAAPCIDCDNNGDTIFGEPCPICRGSKKMPPSIGVTELRSGQMVELQRSDGKCITVGRPTFDAIHGEAAWTVLPVHDGVE